MVHEEICTYEVAKLAKENGFNGNGCFKHYDQNGLLRSNRSFSRFDLTINELYKHDAPSEVQVYAPTQSLLQRWLREERGIIIEVFMDDDSNMPLTYNIHQYKDWNWECVCHHHGNYYAVNDWELCLEDAIKYALENLV